MLILQFECSQGLDNYWEKEIDEEIKDSTSSLFLLL